MTLAAIAVAVTGIVQPPFVPHTANLTVSAAPTGVCRSPTPLSPRVSAKRHGTIGTSANGVSVPDAPTCRITPIPATVAAKTAAATPTCTTRNRRNRRNIKPPAVRRRRTPNHPKPATDATHPTYGHRPSRAAARRRPHAAGICQIPRVAGDISLCERHGMRVAGWPGLDGLEEVRGCNSPTPETYPARLQAFTSSPWRTSTRASTGSCAMAAAASGLRSPQPTEAINGRLEHLR